MNNPDLFDALLSKLGDDVSPRWTETFAARPGIDVDGYKRLQALVNEHGEETVRRVFEYAYETRIKPKTPNAYPLAATLCRSFKNGRD